MSQQGPPYGYPQYQQPYQPTPPGQIPGGQYPQNPYTDPVYYPVNGPYTPAGYGAGVLPGTTPAPQPKRRKALRVLVPMCVVLALVFAGSAYFLFFSGGSPSDVVTEFVSDAQKGDFAAARKLVTSDAPDALKFRDNAEGMETMRRWFTKSHMGFHIRNESTKGTRSTVVVDKTLDLPNYEDIVRMRWDYKLHRDSGTWRISGAKLMTVVDMKTAEPGGCLHNEGFSYKPADCADLPENTAESILSITDKVKQPSDCPDPKGEMVETTDHAILCLDLVAGTKY